MPRLLPPLPHSLYLKLRFIFMSRFTLVLVVLISAVAFLLHAVLPHEPSETDIVQAFGGYKTKYFEAGPLPGIGNIVKKACNPAPEVDGYLCEIQYTQKMLSAGAPAQYTRV
ncbi:MAG: hypothetical protein EON54_12885 [Alcaligenaceae bacterium]|nr:MAG: hypothetical protein EON54_12885 [Alcaligenaceae bacterium]